MVVCNFFLQGRCRYGDQCWNEHPRGGSRGGGGYNDSYSRSGGQQQPRGGGGGGGYGNRVWVNPSQQRGGYIQPSAFSSQGSSDWGSGRGGGGGGGGGGRGGGGGGGGGGRRENLKSSDFSFSSSNRFSALDASNAFDKGGRGAVAGLGTAGDEDDDKKLEVIQADMDAWESSGQWGFSCYSSVKTPLSGFSDLSPEELRLEYYSTRASGDLQGYLNGVNQLFSQWKSRVQELKIMSPSTRLALLAELKGTAPQSSSSGFGSTTTTGFGSSTSSFGSKGFGAPEQSVNFGFPALSSGFGSSSTSSLSTGFGSLITAPTQPTSGFGSSAVPSASSFSFTAPSADKPPPAASSGFGSASGFSFSSTTATTGGGLGSAFGAAAASLGAGAVGETADGLFSPESKLTQEELNQFKAKRFTLGQIPLKPPPANMLVV
ncbi:nucleoporin NUP42 isoform X2 [Xiphophorus hellerii]|uniref:nucleoporin NUP42 isoform X2 n=1 Tax=Xiphophorus hellerii TaxID=8084 RepID=UPI0013B38ABB|nr:nucleoporin NUP42 isoform X2 [Xiphophorus hellerii]